MFLVKRDLLSVKEIRAKAPPTNVNGSNLKASITTTTTKNWLSSVGLKASIHIHVC